MKSQSRNKNVSGMGRFLAKKLLVSKIEAPLYIITIFLLPILVIDRLDKQNINKVQICTLSSARKKQQGTNSVPHVCKGLSNCKIIFLLKIKLLNCRPLNNTVIIYSY